MIGTAVYSTSSGVAGPLLIIAIITSASIAGWWKVFEKAEHPGWGALIPIYNIYLTCKIARRPGWWTVLFFVPLVNVVILALVMLDIAKAFRKSVLFGIGLWLVGFVFAPILGFGDAEYDEYEDDFDDYAYAPSGASSDDWRADVPATGAAGAGGMTPQGTGFPAHQPQQSFEPVVTPTPVAPVAPPTPPVSSLPPAGWFEDPQNPSQLRYWDGAQWTNHYHPKQG